MGHEDMEIRVGELLRRFDPNRDRRRRIDRPFTIELFGTPKSGKSTMKEMLKHFFKRNGWLVSTPQEGAEVVELPRDEPTYNFQTCEYAMMTARDRSYSGQFHIVVMDRAIFDGVVRMEYYRGKGILTPPQQATIEGYYLLPWMRDLFDLHVCLVASPEVAIRREFARAITKKDGETMNPATLRRLLEAHRAVWERLGGDTDHRLVWHDSSLESEEETAVSLIQECVTAFERRLAGC
jgi:hypothetical protein